MAFNNQQKKENVNRTIMRFFNDQQETLTSFSIKAWNGYISFGIRPLLEKDGNKTLYDSQNEITFLCNQQSLYTLYSGLKLIKAGKTNSIAIEDLEGKLLRVYKDKENNYAIAIVNADKKLKTIVEQIEFTFMSKNVIDNTNLLYVNIFEDGKEVKNVKTCADYNCFYNFIKYINDCGITYGVQTAAMALQYQIVGLRNSVEIIKKYFETDMVNKGNSFGNNSGGFNKGGFSNNSRSSGRFGSNRGFGGKSSKEFPKKAQEFDADNAAEMLDDDEEE